MAYSTNDALLIYTKINDLNMTFMLKIAFSDFVIIMGIVFNKYILFQMDINGHHPF